MKSLRALLLVPFLAASLAAQEDYSTWTHAKPIRVRTNAIMTSGVSQFPLLVRLNASNAADVFSGAKSGGADIRFGRGNGTKLAYEIERWDAAAQVAEIWVRMDTVRPNDTLQTLWLYWGKADANAASNGSAVFSASNGYVAVWHMNGAGSGGQVNEVDAVSGFTALQHSTSGGNPASSTSGPIGYHRILSASDNTTGQGFVTNDPAKANFLFTDNYKVSAWANPTTLSHNQYPTIVSKHDNQWTLRANTAETGPWLFFYGNPGGSESWPGVNSSLYAIEGEWAYIAGVRSVGDDALHLYVNGLLDASYYSPPTDGAQPTDNSVAIGKRAEADDRYWNGALDEIRLESAARSADWIRLEYETQRANSTVLAFGATVTPAEVGIHGDAIALEGAFAARATGAGYVFELPKVSGLANLSVLDANGRVVWSARLADGQRAVEWNGRRADGRAANAGLYFARLTSAGGRSWLARVAVTR